MPLYGLNAMGQLNTRAEFTDDGHQPIPLNSFVERIEQSSAKAAGIGFNLSQAIRLLSRFKRYDVIFATADASAVPVLALKSLGLIKTPVVFQSIGLMEFMRFRKETRIFRIYRRWVNSADKVICFSWDERDAFADLFGISIKRIRLLLPCIDLDYFYPANAVDGNLILSVGRDAFRDYATLIRSVDGLISPVRIIASPGNLAGLRIPGNVSLMYDIPIAELREWYRQCRFVVVPERDNIYSAGHSVFLQAMAMQRACIISATAAISRGYDFLRSGENCILVKPGDFRELRSAIEWLAGNLQQADQIGKAARRVVERYFTVDQYAKSLAETFFEVISNQASDEVRTKRHIA